MSNCLCIYYSRTGNTRAVMEKIAELLDAELLEITDGKARKGVVGFVAAGLDAMKKTPEALMPFQTKHPLGQYDEIVLATPVWAGRCSSITRSFLIEHGKELPERWPTLLRIWAIRLMRRCISRWINICPRRMCWGCPCSPKPPITTKKYTILCARCAVRRRSRSDGRTAYVG